LGINMKNQKNRGFSLVELLIVMIILMIVMGAIFSLITMATARSATEQAKLDMFQEAREFMDQMSRDLRQAGFPNTRNFAPGVLATPPQNDQRAASGLVMVADGELWFEGDMDGSGTVSVVHYWLDPSTQHSEQLSLPEAKPVTETRGRSLYRSNDTGLSDRSSKRHQYGYLCSIFKRSDRHTRHAARQL
jgi:type II secretory pathway pseudopilin PulG